MLVEFLNEYGTMILYAIVTFVGGYIGIAVKSLYTKYVNDRTKEAVVKTVVKGVQQVYYDLKGDEKLAIALANASEMLEEKGIEITDLELRMLIEAAVAEFKGAFHKDEPLPELPAEPAEEE